MKTDALYRVQKKDLKKASQVLANAFRNDPIFSVIFDGAEPGQHEAFYESAIRFCLTYGEVYAPTRHLEGVAGWVPGEVSQMTLWRMVRSGALWSGMKMGSSIAKTVEEVFKPVDQDRQENMIGKKYYYLQIIGVAENFQGQGFGSQLLNALIQKGETAERQLYLETETEENVQFYQGFGFEVIKKIELPMINLPMWEMVREVEKSK